MIQSTPERADVKVIQRMVDAMVGIERFSYPARQNGEDLSQPKPKGEFAHIRVIEEYPAGLPRTVRAEQGSTTSKNLIYSPVRIRARIGVVDTTGIPAMRIMGGWTSNNMRNIMTETGYGFIQCTPLSSEDAKLEKEWEYRKGFSVDLYVTRVYEEVVDNITSMSIAVNYVDKLDKYFGTININD